MAHVNVPIVASKMDLNSGVNDREMIINFIQDIATPNNNVIIKSLSEGKGVRLNLWYAFAKHPQYSWKADLTNEVKTAHIYGYTHISWKLVFHVLRN